MPGQDFDRNVLRTQLNVFLKTKEEIKDTLAAGVEEMGYHGPLAFFGDQPARLDPPHVLAGGGGLQPALAGDFQKGKTGLGANQLKNPDAVLIGKGLGDQGQAGQRVGLVNRIHMRFNSEK